MASLASMPMTSSISALASRDPPAEVHLVEDGDHLDPQLQRRVAIRDRLGLHTLARIDHQQGALARRQRATDLVAEVHMPRRVDQIQVVDPAIARGVAERCRLSLDGDAALALEVHRVEHLRFHLSIAEPSAALDQPIGKRRFAMVDMGDDREIADVVHACCSASQGSGESANGYSVARCDELIVAINDVKPKRAVSRTKKRHVESLTRLPTKRMATACWAFIVAKRTPWKTAPLLDFGSLHGPNIENHPQDIHK